MNQTSNNIKKLIVEPKVYGLLLETAETIFLSVQYAYSLEEAVILAKLEYEKQNPFKDKISGTLMGAKIGLFAIKTLKELTEEKKKEGEIKNIESVNIPQRMPEVNPNEKTGAEKIKLLPTSKEKNLLMKEIIEKKDKSLFKKNIEIFSETELKYLKERLKEVIPTSPLDK